MSRVLRSADGTVHTLCPMSCPHPPLSALLCQRSWVWSAPEQPLILGHCESGSFTLHRGIIELVLLCHCESRSFTLHRGIIELVLLCHRESGSFTLHSGKYDHSYFIIVSLGISLCTGKKRKKEWLLLWHHESGSFTSHNEKKQRPLLLSQCESGSFTLHRRKKRTTLTLTLWVLVFQFQQ